MPRAFLFEFEDQRWFPQIIRQGMMDYLRHMIGWLEFYKPAAEIIKNALEKSQNSDVVELSAGGGGGVTKMIEYLQKIGRSPRVILTDLYPNISTWQDLKNASSQIDYIGESVNALQVPEHITGLRVMFSALHHFKPNQVKQIFLDTMSKKASLAFFDAGTTSPLNILTVLLFEPITFVLLTPLFKPFRWSRLFFTYIIPLIIVCTLWDGSISVLRFYRKRELRSILRALPDNNYIWKVGTFKNKWGIPVNYVTGYPFNQNH